MRLASLALGALACGGEAGPPPPDVVAVGPVSIETDPLCLRAAGGTAAFEVCGFVEVGRVEAVDPGRYYDPRGDDAVTWHAAARAVAWDPATGALTLDNGATLTVTDGPAPDTATLAVDVAGDADGAALVRLAWPLAAGEPIYGFGENFASADAAGSVREMQFRVDLDSESSLNEVHVPVPLALWPARGAGVFVEDARPGAFDVGAARADRVLATVARTEPGPVRAHVFVAGEPLDLCRRYAALTALPAVPPKWAFAPQQWRNEHDSSDQVREDAQAMRALDIPGSAIWIDNPWQTGYNTFEFDETRFSEPAALVADLRALGYRVVVWSTPYVNRGGPTAADFADAAERGYLVTDGAAPVVFPWQDGPGALVDFTADGATQWWRERIARATALGVSGFKLDFGEDLVPELGGRLTPFRLAAGTAQTLHNAYQYGYHEAYLGALPPGDGWLITRAGSFGEQAVNTTIWPGDLDNDFSRHGVDNGDGQRNVGGLPAAVAAGLSLSVSGYPFFGSDIGGFRNGEPTPEALIRWAEYAALGTIMQLGGGGASHNPWDVDRFGPDALAIYRRYARLHMDLVPYLYTLAVRAGTDGTPVVRPTRFIYPDARSDDATYLVGDALFVAPVIEEGATTRVVAFPPGRWIDWWTGVAETEPERQVPAPLDRLPLWRRANAFVPMFARAADTLAPATDPAVRSYADPAYGRHLALWITPDGPRADIALYDGATASAERTGDVYRLSAAAGDEFDTFVFALDLRASDLRLDPSAVLPEGDPDGCDACYRERDGVLYVRTGPGTVDVPIAAATARR
ncbi:MAG: glycoside hydrolase family 31 protein [Deltaproteobacteria bacterium]|nr:MAG: glycoside hydrolase family 31 protein [Deltaproteobacteria bacterium]